MRYSAARQRGGRKGNRQERAHENVRADRRRHVRLCIANRRPDLLNRPLASLADCLAIEEIALEQRLGIEDFNQRIAFALAENDPNATALYYVPDGDIERPPITVSLASSPIASAAPQLCCAHME